MFRYKFCETSISSLLEEIKIYQNTTMLTLMKVELALSNCEKSSRLSKAVRKDGFLIAKVAYFPISCYNYKHNAQIMCAQ